MRPPSPRVAVSAQRAYFEEKLSELGGYTSAKAARMVRAVTGAKRKGTRKKAAVG